MFLDEWDSRALTGLKAEAVKLAQEGAKLSTKHRIVLNANRLNEDGTPFVYSHLKPIPAKKQMDFVMLMRASLTGIADGDVLVGTSKNNRDMRVQYTGPTIPPGKAIHRLTDAHAKALFYDKLGEIPRFNALTPQQREAYCEANMYVIQRDCSIAMFEESRLTVIDPGRCNDVTGLSQAQMAEVMERSWSGEEFVDYMEEALGRGTLILLQGMWKVIPSVQVKRQIRQAQYVLDVTRGAMSEVKQIAEDQELIHPQDTPYGFLVDREPIALTWDTVWPVGLALVAAEASWDAKAEEEWKGFVLRLTPGELKSLLQKLIRYRARQLELPSKNTLPITCATLMCATALLIHPGSFVPNLQMFASGLHGLTKRLGVICFEDARIPGNAPTSLLMMAWLSQQYREWRPSKRHVGHIMRTVLDCLASEEAYIFSKSKGATYSAAKFKDNVSSSLLASALIDVIGSFDGDRMMIRHIAHEQQITRRADRPALMPYYHFVDQHCAPGMAFLSGQEDHSDPQRPFGPFFRRVFSQVSGINPRRGAIPAGDEVDHIKDVQWLYAQFKYLYAPKELPPYGQNHYAVQYTLDDGWIAGLIGPLEFSVDRSKVFVTVNVRDINQQVVMFKPTRSTADDALQLSDTMRQRAIDLWRQQLKKGVSASRAVDALVPQLLDKRITYDGEQYKVGGIPWGLFKTLQSSVPYAMPVDYGVREVASSWGMMVRQGGPEAIMAHFKQASRDVQQRLVFFLSGYHTQVRLQSIGREGDGQNVTAYDALVHDQLLFICHHAPAALQINQPGRFHSPLPPLLWGLRDQMARHVATETVEQKGQWVEMHTPAGRQAWNHQTQALSEMQENYTRGFQGSFMHLEVGSGKTSVLLWFLMWLQQGKKLPEYIVYSAPYSALISVAEEMDRFGLPIDYISSSLSEQVEQDYEVFLENVNVKGYKKKFIPDFVTFRKSTRHQPFPELRPFRVSLIEHDSLRKGSGEVMRIIPKAIFVMDEVHKALADTQRTAHAVQMARLAHHFVAFTGTAVLNNKFESLIQWLDMITPFPLNTKNFWVAVNAMIARNFKTGIECQHEFITVPMTDALYKEYQTMVPRKLGGTAVKINFRGAVDLCYQTCDSAMVQRVVQLWDQGVVLVARDSRHQVRLLQMLKQAVPPQQHNRLFVLNRDVGSISLTDENVEAKRIADYKVVIVPMQHNAGYNLTRLGCMINSVYLSNEASRAQMRGRIDRLGQKRNKLLYETYACGVLINIHRHYLAARSLSNAIKSAAMELEIDARQLRQ